MILLVKPLDSPGLSADGAGAAWPASPLRAPVAATVRSQSRRFIRQLIVSILSGLHVACDHSQGSRPCEDPGLPVPAVTHAQSSAGDFPLSSGLLPNGPVAVCGRYLERAPCRNSRKIFTRRGLRRRQQQHGNCVEPLLTGQRSDTRGAGFSAEALQGGGGVASPECGGECEAETPQRLPFFRLWGQARVSQQDRAGTYPASHVAGEQGLQERRQRRLSSGHCGP